MAGSASEWDTLGGVFYERREIYSLAWGVDVDASRVACAPFGGPVAIVRDDRKIVKNAAGQARSALPPLRSAPCLPRSRSASGARLRARALWRVSCARAPCKSSTPWARPLASSSGTARRGWWASAGQTRRCVSTGSGLRTPRRRRLRCHPGRAARLRHVALTLARSRRVAAPRAAAQVLLCVSDDGGVYPYSVDGELLPWQLSLGAECAAQRVADACVLPTGVVALTHEAQLFAVRRRAAARCTPRVPVTGLLRAHALSGSPLQMPAAGDQLC
jgi:hypothetical protein